MSNLPLATTSTGSIIQLGTSAGPFSPPSTNGVSTDGWGSIKIAGFSYVCPTDGLFWVRGAKRAYKWDIQEGAQLYGAIERFKGVVPPPFQLEMIFWTTPQFTTWLEIAQVFQINVKKLLSTQNQAQIAAQLAANQAALNAVNAATAAQNDPTAASLLAATNAANAAQAAQTNAQASSVSLLTLQVPAVTIYHPTLDAIGISQVICEAIGAPEQISDDHIYRSVFDLREFQIPVQLPRQDYDSAPTQPTDPISPSLANKSAAVANLQQQVTSAQWLGINLQQGQ